MANISFLTYTLIVFGLGTAIYPEQERYKIRLEGKWKINLQDNKDFSAKDYNPSSWEDIDLPGSFISYSHKKHQKEEGLLWLRKSIILKKNLQGQTLGLILGRIANADETYFNGTLIGKTGSLRSGEMSMWNHPRHYLIPEKLINFGAENIISVRVSYGMFGEVSGELLIDDLENWTDDKQWQNFIRIILIYSVIGMGAGYAILFFLLYLKRRENLYFYYILQVIPGLFIMIDACNFWAFGHNLIRMKMFFISWCVLATTHTMFLHRFYNVRRKKTEMLLVVIFLPLIILFLGSNDLSFLRQNASLMLAALLPAGIYNISIHFFALYKKHPNSKWLSALGSIAVIGAMQDCLIYINKIQGFNLSLPFYRLDSVIFSQTAIAFFAGVGLFLMHKFINLMRTVEDLNENLEKKVTERTQELEKSFHETSQAIEYAFSNQTLAAAKKNRYAISDATEKKIKQAILYINENFRSDISREGLAASLSINHDHLGKAFKIYTGKKISEYINEIRIKEAVKKIKMQHESIIDIAYAVGFESPRTFNRAFMKIIKQSPSDYRQTIPESPEIDG